LTAVAGTIRDATYAGAVTRYTVELDGGGSFTTVAQNFGASAPAAERGRRVRLAWEPKQLRRLDAGDR
jgi:hypothetical protein